MRRRVDIGDAHLEAVVAGTGPVTVVFESGLVTPLEIWDAVVGPVADRARTLRYDHRSAPSTARAPSRSVSDILTDLEQLLVALSLHPPYVFVGHSWGALRRVLDAQQKAHKKLKEAGHIIPNVFWRMVAEGRGGPKKPQPIVRFDKAWKLACKLAGCPGRIPHNMRRTAVRNLVRAGVPQSVAMKMTGHKTDSVFRRYDIVSEGDLRDAAARLDAVAGA